MWINLFQDTLAALALATDPPQPRVLDRKPESRRAPLITASMWKTIIGQTLYQTAVTLVLYFAGPRIFPYQTSTEINQVNTLVFNTYVWLQIFNMYKYVAYKLLLYAPRLGTPLSLIYQCVCVCTVAGSTTTPSTSLRAFSAISCL